VLSLRQPQLRLNRLKTIDTDAAGATAPCSFRPRSSQAFAGAALCMADAPRYANLHTKPLGRLALSAPCGYSVLAPFQQPRGKPGALANRQAPQRVG
jgi:hypothetical protein